MTPLPKIGGKPLALAMGRDSQQHLLVLDVAPSHCGIVVTEFLRLTNL